MDAVRGTKFFMLLLARLERLILISLRVHGSLDEHCLFHLYNFLANRNSSRLVRSQLRRLDLPITTITQVLWREEILALLSAT